MVELGPKVRRTRHGAAWLAPHGPPDARNRNNDAVIEMWVPRQRTEIGAWLDVHVRVRNVGSRSFWAFCAPTYTYADFSSLFDPGLAWTGDAARFKALLLAAELGRQQFLYRTGEGLDCPGGDIGQNDRLSPGESWDIDLAVFPRYFVDNQAYPAGSIDIVSELRYAFAGGGELSHSITATASAEIAGRPFPGASPQQLADAVLMTPGFTDWLDARDQNAWANVSVAATAQSKAIDWRLFGFTGPAPNGTVTLGLFADGSGTDFSGEVLLDPWTARSFGFVAR